MKPGKEMHADREPRAGHPCNMNTVRATGKKRIKGACDIMEKCYGTLFTTEEKRSQCSHF